MLYSLRIILPLLLFISNFSLGQINADTLNKFDKNNKKTGYWLVYLDCNLNACKEINAAYYGFDYWENGQWINPIQQYTKRISKKVDFEIPPVKGKPVVLNGKYVFYDKKGRIDFLEVFQNGTTVRKEAYSYYKNGRSSKEVIDYTQPYKGQPNSFCYKLYYNLSDTIPSVLWWQGKLTDGKWHKIKS